MANDRLTDRAIKNAKPTSTVRYLSDGAGLRLRIMPTGAKHWLYRYKLDRREYTFMLGVYPEVGLADARSKLVDARQQVAAGRNPVVVRKLAVAAVVQSSKSTFAAVSAEWLSHNKDEWSPSHHERNTGLVRRVLLPKLGSLPVADITEQAVLEELVSYYKTGRKESARRAGVIARQVFTYAKDSGLIESNPVRDVTEHSKLKKPEVTHFSALKAEEVGPMLRKLKESGHGPVVKAAVILMLLTGLRDASLRGALWSEIDLDAGQWTVPASRMKRGVEHKVPLPTWAVDTLRSLEPLTRHGPHSFVFASGGEAGFLAENTIRMVLHSLGFRVTAHGLRSLMTDVLNEHQFNPDAIERQLHHIEKNKVRKAYLRSDFWDYRIKMMQWFSDWAQARRDQADEPAMPGNVIQFKAA